MRHAMVCLILLTLSWGPAFARPHAQGQSQRRSSPQPVYEGPLELPCAKVLALPSSDFIAQIVAIDDSNVDGQLRGIRRYDACYDARTDALAASLARSGKGPSRAMRADFVAFESTLKDFTAKAFADVPPQPVSQKEAYANLYEKQFRYEFYKEYEAKTVKAAKPAPPVAKPPASAAPAAAIPPAVASSVAPSAATAQERARSDADPVTVAKNHFGKLLEVLPDDKMHELHRAFGDVIGPHQISEATRLAVYRYAIFILEPPSATPSSPPPF
jgi:hypothetical protein